MNEIDPDARQEIEQRLARISEEDGVRFLLAVESGSRAWGFPSPDSDYDVRFIYLRPTPDYLSLRSIRDVIERPIIDDFDVNGWDVRKALSLLLNHNAVVAEWMNSPIRYVPDDPIVARISELADRFFDPHGYAMHYASLGKNNFDRWDSDAESISVKRYFYALRPALSVRALRIDPGQRPPMRLQDLMKVCKLSPELTDEIDRLVLLKSERREAAPIQRSSAIEHLVADELVRADEISQRRNDAAFGDAAEALFRDLVTG